MLFLPSMYKTDTIEQIIFFSTCVYYGSVICDQAQWMQTIVWTCLIGKLVFSTYFCTKTALLLLHIILLLSELDVLNKNFKFWLNLPNCFKVSSVPCAVTSFTFKNTAMSVVVLDSFFNILPHLITYLFLNLLVYTQVL